MSKQIIQSNKVPAPIGPYSQAVIANGLSTQKNRFTPTL